MKVRSIMISTSSFQFLSFLRRAIFYAFFYLYLRNFLGLSNTMAALLGTANLLGSTIGQLLIWGPRLNKNPTLAKKYVVRGEVIAGFVYLFAFFGQRILISYESKVGAAIFLILLFSFLELFWSGSDLGIRHLIAEATQGDHRGRLVGTLDAMGLLGQICGFLLGGWLYQNGLGFYEGTVFYVVVFLLFSCAFIIQFTPIETIKIQEVITTSELVNNGVREAFKVPFFAIFIIILGILTIGFSSSTQTFYYYVIDETGFNLSAQLFSILLILFSLCGGLLAPIGGRISDRIGRIPIIIISSLVAAICYLLFFILTALPFTAITFIYAVMGASTALVQSIAFAYTADLLPQDLQGTGFGIFNITLATGWGLASFLIGGPIADILILLGESRAIAYRFTFFVSSFILLVGTTALLGLHALQKKRYFI
ncbi:MAG: MFS transporter [Candidatus Hodarchaeota archaeon]